MTSNSEYTSEYASGYTIEDALQRMARPVIDTLSTPDFNVKDNERRMSYDAMMRGCATKIGLAVESMKQHTTDEGWQIFQGLEHNGWHLSGYKLDGITNVPAILHQYEPGVVLVQDKREWDLTARDFRDPNAKFHQVSALKERNNVFKLTILKDVQQRPNYHCESANEIGCHAWVVYYHPAIVKHLAPYTRVQHLIRTYHTVNNNIVPEFRDKDRLDKAILSGAISNSYPLRTRLYREHYNVHGLEVLRHPGYHRDGCHTPAFLHTLSRYKIAICTASVFGYALRKIIEATACGCRVITDLPIDERMPVIDENLIRVHPDISLRDMGEVVNQTLHSYDYDFQKTMSDLARTYYDYRHMTLLLDEQINNLRRSYS